LRKTPSPGDLSSGGGGGNLSKKEYKKTEDISRKNHRIRKKRGAVFLVKRGAALHGVLNSCQRGGALLPRRGRGEASPKGFPSKRLIVGTANKGKKGELKKCPSGRLLTPFIGSEFLGTPAKALRGKEDQRSNRQRENYMRKGGGGSVGKRSD